MTERINLSPESVQAIATAVARLLRDEQPSELLTAAELAQRLNLSRATIYARSHDFGAIRLGQGKKPRLRFDPARVAAVLEADQPPATHRPTVAPSRSRVRRTPDRTSTGVPLLPITQMRAA